MLCYVNTTAGNPEEGLRPPIAPAEPVYEPRPHTHQTVVSIEQPSAVPQLDTEPQTEVCLYETPTGSLTLVMSADTSLEYGSVHILPGPLKEVLRQVIRDQRTAERYSKYVHHKSQEVKSE